MGSKPISSQIRFFKGVSVRGSVQGIRSLGSHYAGSLIFVKQKINIIVFQKEKGNTFTFLIIFIVKSLQKEQNT